jgi:hypothetical protein
MTQNEEGVWATTLQVNETDAQYKYLVLTKPELEPHIDGDRTLDVHPDAPASCTIFESLGGVARSIAFAAPTSDHLASSKSLVHCRFELVVDDDEAMEILVFGAHPALGASHPEDGIHLIKEAESNIWVATADLPQGEEIAYKYVVWRSATRHMEKLRQLHIPADGSKVHVSDSIGQQERLLSCRRVLRLLSLLVQKYKY